MSEPYRCPVEGCDYIGGDLDALRRHANAKPDHDWSNVEDLLDEDTGDDTDPESEDTERESEQESEDEPGMPTESEIERQRQRATDRDLADDVETESEATDRDSEQEPSETDPGSSKKGRKPLVPIPVSTSTLVIAGGVLVGVVVLYLVITSPSGSTAAEELPEIEEIDEEESENTGQETALIEGGEI